MSYLVYKTYSNNIQPYTEITYIELKRNNISYIQQQYSNNIKQYLKMNSYINLLPAGQTPCPNPLPSISSSSPTTPRFALCLLLLPQNSNTPYTATPQRRFALFFFFPNTATPRRCTNAALCLLPQTTKTQPLALRLLDHDLLTAHQALN